MRKKFKRQPEETTVYSIRCLPVRRIYVGKTKNLKLRLQRHRSDLNTGRHLSSLMQADFDMWGWESFRVKIISRTSGGNRLERKLIAKLFMICEVYNTMLIAPEALSYYDVDINSSPYNARALQLREKRSSVAKAFNVLVCERKWRKPDAPKA